VLELASHLANTAMQRPWPFILIPTTHQQLSEKEQLATGVKPDFIRLSIGIENIRTI
jgi:O-acetylhomoserine/O-acetylserine sulfhydrylase-like pyridoxal-dependent enzyme